MAFGRYRQSKVLFGGIILLVVLWIYISRKPHRHRIDSKYNVMVWWNPYKTHFDYHRKCGPVECRFTSDRSARRDEFFTGYLFDGSKIEPNHLPPRQSHEYWALYHDSSPKDVPFLLQAIDVFNFTSSFSRFSDVPLTLQSFTSLEELINYKAMYSFGEKSAFQRKSKLAPVLYIQSRCDTLTGRELYVQQLGKHIAIDSYGACLKNKTYPWYIRENARNASDVRHFYDFVAQYKFMIVYQDLACEDYITAKFWKSLSLGVVPIYFGAPNIRNYFPNQDSAILIDDFASPAELAEFVKKVASNEEWYKQFLYHKTIDLYPIENQLLVDYLYKQDMYYVKNRKSRTIAEFECHVCTHSSVGFQQRAQQREFTCSLPRFPPGNVTFKAMPRVEDFLSRVRRDAAVIHNVMN